MYLNCEELAAILRVNPETIRRKTRSGVIPHMRVGTSVRYVLADVERALTDAARKEVKGNE